MKKFRKIVFWVFIVVSITILLASLLAYVLANKYENELKAYVINKIDKEFSAQIDVETIDLNFLRKFPNASLHFRNIMVTDNHIAENPPILTAKNLFLQFNIRDILQKKFILRKVEISEGKIDLLIYKGGKNNYNLFQDSTSENSDFFLSAKSMILKNMVLSYENQNTAQYIELFSRKTSIPFEINSKEIKTGLEGIFDLKTIRSEGYDLIKNISCEINSRFIYRYENKELIIEPTNLIVNTLPIDFSGNISFSGQEISPDLKFSIHQMELRNMVEYLPMEAQAILGVKNQKGRLSANLFIKGTTTGSNLPKINGDFSIDQATVNFRNGNFLLSNLNLSGDFGSGKRNSIESFWIDFQKINGLMNGKRIAGKLALKNLKNPLVKSEIEVELDLADLHQKLQLDFFQQLEGSLIAQFSYIGLAAELTNIQNLSTADIEGKFSLKSGKMQIEGQDIVHSNIQAKGVFSSDQIVFEQLNLQTDQIVVSASATIYNYLQLIDNHNNKPVVVDANVHANSVSLRKILDIITLKSNNEESNLKFIAKIDFKSDQFFWEKLELQNVKGQFNYYEDEWSINNALFKFNEGQFSGNISSKPGSNHQSIYSVNGAFKNLNIKKTFASFNNFDQDIITQRNISGLASGTINMVLLMNANGDLLTKSIKASSDFKIENGQLVDVSQLNALSKYTKVDDFSSIKFSTISNSITIENEVVKFPLMHIESDKLSMDIYGNHGFDNSYDYHLNVLLSEIIGRKVNKTTENEFGIVQDDGTGKTRLFLRIFGKGEKFEVKYDRKEASNKVKEDLKTERQEITTTLRNEFIDPEKEQKRQAKKAEREEEINKIKRQENGEIIIRWDDDDEEE